MSKNLAMIAVVLAIVTSRSFGQEPPLPPCLHRPPEAPVQRARREQALKIAHQINLAEAVFRSKPNFRQPSGYRPLRDLPNILPTPAGFRVQFYTDGPTYTFSIKDTLDACEYAIFSDQDEGIYEAVPSKNVGVLPVGTN
jgi:hypothetical protein